MPPDNRLIAAIPEAGSISGAVTPAKTWLAIPAITKIAPTNLFIYDSFQKNGCSCNYTILTGYCRILARNFA